MNDKLIAIQGRLSVPKAQRNSFGNYNYRSCEDILEALKPLLKEQNLVLTLSDEVVNIGAHNYIKATARLAEGETCLKVTALAREAETKKGMDDAQITGAASSYARKYALNGLFAIDDTRDADTQDNRATTEKAPETKSVFKATPKQIETMFSLAKGSGYEDKAEAHKWLIEKGDKDPLLMSSIEASALIGKLMEDK